MKDTDYKAAYLSLYTRIRELYSLASVDVNNIAEARIRIRTDNALPPKTELEAKIVASVANGCTSAETGNLLGRSNRTIETRLMKLRHKYGVSNTYQLIAVFFRNGWIK